MCALESSFFESLISQFGFEPTHGQLEMFRMLSDFMSSEDGDIMIVKGYAGTGKTTAVASLVKTLRRMHIKCFLMAPTGRSAKILSAYAGYPAKTIHKQIYRQKSMKGAFGVFTLDFNKNHDSVYIVDESSMISISGESAFGSGNLLSDMMDYVRSNSGNRIIFIGDDAQLPPVSYDRSPALDEEYMSGFGPVRSVRLTDVVRQQMESGILYNATKLRISIAGNQTGIFPEFETDGYADIEKIKGGELIETLDEAISRYGLEETVVLCRSNKRANRYNAGIRGTVLNREAQLSRGDRLMIVKNCYQFLDEIPELDFIANGDIAKLVRISHFEERYGLHFAKATLSFPDYSDVEIDARIILDTLTSETASLGADMQKSLYEGVYEDYSEITSKKKRNDAVREDPYYNALQIKYSSAITCHKSQGGQWKCVFIDNPFWNGECTLDDLKWLYTAMTRAVEKLYLVNFR